ncbi:MAG: CoB--CoM heterodisulfide reductase iron-sulfur subunit B family protein [Thermodesulfobacteriota bacterium]|nr:CoB--CoM heterodisulfide reductase iron-sulfur subunit B family protein [Thermodesulfobacteriota bacterium]
MTERNKDRLRYALFLGCLIPARFPRFEYLARRLLPELGIELVDLEGFSCCPDPVRFRGADQFTWLTLAARNLAIAGEENLPILTLCPACTVTLATASLELQRNPELVKKVNETLGDVGRKLEGPVSVRHFLKVLYEDIGPERLRGIVKRPLSDLRVSYHSGCHENNPPEIMRFDNPFNPKKTEELLDALGVRVVDYREKSQCCGSPLTLDGKMDDSLHAVVRKVEDISRFGAEALAVGCTSCFQQFEIGQVMAMRKELTNIQLPVFHFLELLALSMGWNLDEIGFREHKVKGGREMLEARLKEGI